MTQELKLLNLEDNNIDGDIDCISLLYEKLNDSDKEGVTLRFKDYAYKLYFNDTFIGMVDYEEKDYETVVVNSLWIKPKYRRQGYGTLIVDMIRQEYNGCYLEGHALDNNAYEFWSSIGVEFDSCEDDCGYYEDCEGYIENCYTNRPCYNNFYMKCVWED